MPSKKSKKSNKSKKYRKKNKTCKIYRSCDHVPCQEAMIGCRPKYCSKGSKSWKSCNMANWKPHETGGVSFEYLQERCKTEYTQKSNCRMSKRNKISTDQVDALELHNKMPYIWRFLDNKTRQKMVRLARKPVSEINVHG